MAFTKIQTQDLVNNITPAGVETPWNSKYYGTDKTGLKGFHGASELVTANNWLDVDAGKVVLGQDVGEAGDPAKLLSNREIPMDGKKLFFKRTDWSYVEIRDTQALLELSSTWFGWWIFQKNPTTWAFYATYISDSWEWILWDEATGNVRIKSNSTGTKIVNNDTTQFQFNNDGTVFFQKVVWIPISTDPTAETMAILPATGKLVRQWAKSWVSWFFVNSIAVPALTLTTVATATLSLDRQADIFLWFRQNFDSATTWFYNVELWNNWVVIFPWFMESSLFNTSGVWPENNIERTFAVTLPAWTNNLEIKLNSSVAITTQNQGFGHILYTYR